MEHREPRLQCDRERHREAQSDERLEDREARLQRDRESHREARSDERLEHREARLQCDRESHREELQGAANAGSTAVSATFSSNKDAEISCTFCYYRVAEM